jgi:polysaccharide deacetylase family protein (PEP-CTERM system associated)
MGDSTKPPIANALTFDVEDWYELTGRQITGTGHARPDLLARQVDRVLDLLSRHATRATFFCLGCSLVDQPQIVRRIADAGHEVASHGWGHELLYRIGLPAFREDLKHSLGWLQDLLGKSVLGYRAPAFSIPPGQLDAFYDVCLECGLAYDSSVYPIRGKRYGIPDGPTAPTLVRQVSGRRLVEFPLAVTTWAGRAWPIAGGGSWRLLPLGAIRRLLASANRSGRGVVTYLHPYEFDPCFLSARSAAGVSIRSLRHGFRQNLRRGTMYGKLDALLGEFRFVPASDLLDSLGRG